MSAAPRPAASPAGLALIYLRESKAEQLDGYSPEAMEARCREKAATLGLPVVGVLVEDGKGDDWNLPKLWEALRLAESGAYTVLLTYDTSRLARDMGKRLWIKRELRKHRVDIRYATVEFSESPEGELHENIMGSFDQYERAKIAMRTGNGIAGKLEKGHVVGSGRTPYGYEPVRGDKGQTVGYAPKEEQAGIVRRIVADLATKTLYEVCAELNAVGVPTPRGAPRWLPATLRSFLKNSVYIGEYRFGQVARKTVNGKIVTTKNDADGVRVVSVPALVTPAEIRAATDAMQRRKIDRRPKRPVEHDPYILRGLLRCGECDGGLSTANNGGFRRYTCLRAAERGGNTCTQPQVPADAIELYAWDAVVRAMGSHCLREELTAACRGDDATRRYRSQVESVTADIARCARRIAGAVDVMLDNPKGSTAWTHAREKQAEAERAKTELEASLRTLEGQAPRVLSPSTADWIWRAAQEMTEGMLRDSETAAGRRSWLRKLGVSATVRVAEGDEGVELGRKYRWQIAWAGLVGLSNGGYVPHGTYLLLDTSAPHFRLDLRMATR